MVAEDVEGVLVSIVDLGDEVEEDAGAEDAAVQSDAVERIAVHNMSHRKRLHKTS